MDGWMVWVNRWVGSDMYVRMYVCMYVRGHTQGSLYVQEVGNGAGPLRMVYDASGGGKGGEKKGR